MLFLIESVHVCVFVADVLSCCACGCCPFTPPPLCARPQQKLLKVLRKNYNDMATARMRGAPVEDSALLKLHADIEDTERALAEVAVGLCGKFNSPRTKVTHFGF